MGATGSSHPSLTMSLPETQWAQRTDKVMLTINIVDAFDVSVEYTDKGEFKFSGKTNTDKDGIKEYALDVELFKGLKPDESKWEQRGRKVEILLQKAEEEWWDRLLKTKG